MDKRFLGGILDLHWNIWSANKIDKEKTISFDIAKDCYILWELFDDLYNEIISEKHDFNQIHVNQYIRKLKKHS